MLNKHLTGPSRVVRFIPYRCYSVKPIVHIPKSSSIHPFGDPSNRHPLLHDIAWTVREGEAWAILSSYAGGNGKVSLFRALLGHLRIRSPSPTREGLYPFIGTDIDPFTRVASVSFSHRSNQAAGSGFYDYTARYGAVREEDAVTLREHMFPGLLPIDRPDSFSGFSDGIPKGRVSKEATKLSPEDDVLFKALVKEMDLEKLLDLPLIALSNGQTRRARIVQAILKKPELLLLDEPLTGLDTTSRPKLLHLLEKLHRSGKPRIILGLRAQDDVPAWVTHLVLTQGRTVKTGQKSDILPLIERNNNHSQILINGSKESRRADGSIVADLQHVNVKYGLRAVLQDINWQVRQGERWHLQGTNGSGKTTLLSLITGDHPQSYTQSHLLLPSPLHPSVASQYALNHRKRIPTPYLHSMVGVVSPELFDAFPRRHPGMSVWEAVGTGFEGVFVPLSGGGVGASGPGQELQRDWRMERMWEVLEYLGPSAGCPTQDPRGVSQQFAERRFSSLTVGEQRMVLLMRALVGRPPLVLLDEVWSGMSEEMVRAARKYLRDRVGDDQAVVVITHYDDEVPWKVSEGLRRIRLDGGRALVEQ